MISTKPNTIQLNTIKEAIADIKKGKIIIVVDDEDRENEGDLVMASECVKPQDINFMAKNARGLICLTVTEDRCRQLDLPLMVDGANGAQFGTNFTLSIEAAEGVTTGISAADRARTVRAAVARDATPDSIVQPGHIFPIMAQPGGVLTRAGHTEAAVDVARLAGLIPSGVICEIMNDDGTMARLPDLVKFAQFHGLKIGTIEDLIAYRMRRDHFVSHVASSNFTSQDGDEFKIHVYRNFLDNLEHVALSKGEPVKGGESLVRVHKIDFAGDILHENSPRSGLIRDTMRQLAAHDGHAVLVLIREGSIDTLLERLGAHKREGDRKEQNIREYGVGAQILVEQGVDKMRIITNTMPKLIGLEAYNLELVGIVPPVHAKDVS